MQGASSDSVSHAIHSTAMDEAPESQEYNPTLTVIMGRPSRRVWTLGTRYIVKERLCPYSDGNVEANATKLLRERSVDVPVPEVVMNWRDGNWTFMISECLPGEPLMNIWSDLADEDRHRIAKQTADMISKFRSITSTTCCAFDGGPIKEVNLLRSLEERRDIGPLQSDDEVWEQIFKPRLDRASVEEEAQQQLRSYMPPSGPHTFTHGDLAYSNILVKDGAVSGIVDFEFSAYLPVWWEYVGAHFGFCTGDGEWKEILREYLEPYEQATDWYLWWAELCKTPRPEDIGIWPQILAKYQQS